MIYRLKNNPNSNVLFTYGLIVEFYTFQHVFKLQLLGKLIKKDDSLFSSVLPNSSLNGRLDELEHHRQDFLIVLNFIEFKDNQAFVFDFISLVFAYFKKKAIYTIAGIF